MIPVMSSLLTPQAPSYPTLLPMSSTCSLLYHDSKSYWSIYSAGENPEMCISVHTGSMRVSLSRPPRTSRPMHPAGGRGNTQAFTKQGRGKCADNQLGVPEGKILRKVITAFLHRGSSFIYSHKL